MTRPLSDDLRRRVVTAVDDGMSRRGAARRFGIAPSTAIKWGSGVASDGQLSAQSARRRQALAADRGASCDGSGAGRRDPGHDPGGDRGSSGERARGAGLPEHGVALLPPPRASPSKKRLTPASSNDLTCCAAGGPGSRPSPASTPISSSSSTRPAPPPRWHDAAVGLRADIGAGRRSPTGTGRPPPSSAP